MGQPHALTVAEAQADARLQRENDHLLAWLRRDRWKEPEYGPPTSKRTATRDAIMEFIETHVAEHGAGPRIIDIARHMECSEANVYRHTQRLTAEGVLGPGRLPTTAPEGLSL